MISRMINRAILTSTIVVTIAFITNCGDRKIPPQENENGHQKGSELQLPDGLTPEQAAKVVAKVGERTITVGEVTRQINRLSPYIRRRWAAPEKRKEFLENLIRVELLSQEAEHLGIADDNPEVQRTLKQVMVRLMIKNEFENELSVASIDEKILKETYEKEKDKYYRPAQIRASQIVLKTREEAEQTLALIKEKGNTNAYFRAKARELSTDEVSKGRGGDIGYFSKPDERREDEPDVPRAVAEAAWQLINKGDLCPSPVETAQGFHIIKLTNKRPEMNRSFNSVKRIIENRLIREKRKEAMDKFIAALRSKAKIEIHEENLKKLELSPQPSPKPVNGDKVLGEATSTKDGPTHNKSGGHPSATKNIDGKISKLSTGVNP